MLFKILITFCLIYSACSEFCRTNIEVFSRNNHLEFDNNETFNLKGINWFGFETEGVPSGLWINNLDFYLDFLKENNFNAIRLPFSVDNIINGDTYLTPDYSYQNPFYDGTVTILESLEFVIDTCAQKGLLVMLNQHRLNNDEISKCYTDEDHNLDVIKESWTILVDRFAHKSNLFAVDIKNEPYDCTWTENIDFANEIGDFIHHYKPNDEDNPPWLIFVEGIGNSDVDSSCTQSCSETDCDDKFFWGENLRGACDCPIDSVFKMDEKLVYSPHVYPQCVSDQDYFHDENFPDNMKDIWDCHFGYITKYISDTVVIGEFGGFYSDINKVWQDAFVDYLISKSLRDSFYWALTPNAGDTGGLLKDDWITPDYEKLDLLDKLQPDPTKFTKNDALMCIDYGR